MDKQQSNVLRKFEMVRRKAPEYLDLICSETDDEFEAAFDTVLEIAIRGLETNRKEFRKLNENGLSSALGMALGTSGFTVTREAHSNGHVDLTIEADHCVPQRVKLAEAKIYDGPKYHIDGLEQLIGRYMTGREGRGLLIAYVRKPDIKGKMAGIRTKMDADLPLDQSCPSKDHVIRWSFITEHKHSSGENIQVGHIGCNLYEPGKRTPKKRGRQSGEQGKGSTSQG